MRIGILGSGLMGGKLGTIFARAGHEVVFSYARSERKLRRLAAQAGDLAGKVVVTCSLPMNEENTELVAGRTSSAAEALARRLPKSRIVPAFNTVPSEVLFGVYEARRKGKRPSLVYCGDDAASKRVAAGLIRDVGFEPLDVGPLRIARYTEPFALLVGQIAYEGRKGPEVAYRFDWSAKQQRKAR
jgi:predicted dinucleotide-binding enzyme